MIEFRNVVRKFGDRVVLNDISFKVDRGEILFLLGTSGTGKSVTLKLLVGLLKVSGGEIFFDGEKISTFSEEKMFEVRRKCGMVFQHPALFDSLTVFENVAFGLRRGFSYSDGEIAERVKKALQLAHVRGVEDKLPQDISYGMQKRVSLARTVAVSPIALLFDEPTTGLDPVTTQAVNKLIQELSRELKTTSIVVSHDMQCALDIADRIIVMDKGKIVAEGTPQDIMNSKVPLVVDFMSEVRG